MIAKRIKNHRTASKFQHVTSLYNYINCLDEYGLEIDNAEEKLIYSGTLNIESQYDSEIIAEMADLAEKCAKSKNPLTHYTISLKEGEKFEEKDIDNIVKMYVNELGYRGCQVIYARHGNTDNDHLHIVVNRADPKTYKCRPRGNDIFRSQKSVAKIVAKYGFDVIDNQPYVVDENGKLVQSIYTKSTEMTKLSEAAIGAEIRSGEKSILRIAIEKALPILRQAKNWIEVHTKLALEGFKYKPVSGGAVLETVCDGKRTSVKSSAVHRSCSIKNMEKRIGKFEQHDVEIVERHAEPAPGIDNDTFQKYQENKREVSSNNKKIVQSESKDQKEIQQQIDDIKKEREVIEQKVLHEIPLVNVMLHRVYKQHNDEEIKRLSKLYRSLSTVHTVHAVQPLPFNEWLLSNNQNAEDIIANLHSSIDLGFDVHNENKTLQLNFRRFDHGLQADNYTVNGLFNGNLFAFKKQNDNSLIYTRDEIITTVLPKIQTLKKDYKIDIIPHSNKFEYIKFNTNNLEIPIRPTCIMKNFESNYDMIFKIPVSNLKNKEAVISKITEEITSKYTTNIKVKGTDFRTSEIVRINEEPCPVLTPFATQLDHFYTYQHENKQQKRSADSDYHKLYRVHYDHIIQHSKLTDSDVDKLDQMIAIRLRATGHNQKQIADIIKAGHAEAMADRIAADAFSKNGDKQIKRYVRFLKEWKIFEERLNLKWFVTQKENAVDKHKEAELEENQTISMGM